MAETSKGIKVLRTSPIRRSVSHSRIVMAISDHAAACSNALMMVLADCSTEIGPPIERQQDVARDGIQPHLAAEFFARGDDPDVGASITWRNAERLALHRDDVGFQVAGANQFQRRIESQPVFLQF